MNRLTGLSGLLRRAAQASARHWASAGTVVKQEGNPVTTFLKAAIAGQPRQLHTSLTSWQEGAHHPEPTAAKSDSLEPPRKYRQLVDKELWHEAWMYEDKFGTEEDPIVVPSVESERIIGVTDPEDDTLVVWGILKEGEGPRQFIEDGEFYVLKLVPYVKKVGDVLEELEASKPKTPLPK